MEQFEPIKLLGEGSFGTIYLMKHKVSRDLVCAKVIKLKGIPPNKYQACRNEVSLMRKFSHPNIVGYIDSFIDTDCLCIIMEYCDAGDLDGRVHDAKLGLGELLSESKVMTWFVQVVLGLHSMHSHRILHRDIKTQNVLILSCGRVVLGDLGISKFLGGTKDVARTCIGTPSYMSPEIIKGMPYNEKSDIWALGCLLYELLTSTQPFESQGMDELVGKIINGKFPPISNVYSKNIRGLVNDMLNVNPKRRPNTEQILRKAFVKTKVREFVNDLKTENLPCQRSAMGSLRDQLMELGMGDFLPPDRPTAKKYKGRHGGDKGGPNGPSSSQSSGALSASISTESSTAGSLSLGAQKHQLEVEEEKRIAAEMALKRLHCEAAEPRHHPGDCHFQSPPGEVKRGKSTSLTASILPESLEQNMGGKAGRPRSEPRRPNLLQRLGTLLKHPFRKFALNRGSSAAVGSQQFARSPARRPWRHLLPLKQWSRREPLDGKVKSSAGGTTLQEGSFSGDPLSSAEHQNTNRGNDSQHIGAGKEQARRALEPSKVDSDSARNERSLGTPMACGARSMSFGRTAEGGDALSLESMFEDDEFDLFSDLKERTRKHGALEEDKEVHDREEELKRMLREAEHRCRDLREGLEKAKVSCTRQESTSTGPPSLDSSFVEPSALEEASEFEDDQPPHCQGRLEEVEDSFTPDSKRMNLEESLRQKCREGLGEETFERAMHLLNRLRVGKRKVTVDGVQYDGTDVSQVEALLICTIGKQKIHYWSMMNQLLLMS